MSLTIAVIGEHPAVQLAAHELQSHLALATEHAVSVEPRAAYDAGDDALWVGLAGAFPALTLPAVEDARFDDAIGIRTGGARGVITGVNPRSALIAAYRYLHALGCRWVRPGADGAYIPHVEIERTAVDVVEAPSYRHRGVCIEGAVSYEHVRDIVDWLPKVGMNSYFIQFREGFTFFDRWYSHAGKPAGSGGPVEQPEEAFTVAGAQALVQRIAHEIEQRDLLFHAVGHGWTCEPFGMRGLGWEYPPEPAPPEVVPYLALVNGKREVWEGIPLNTNLCYSNPDVRRIVAQAIAEYAEAHPEVDLLHFWLADGANNHCECDACRELRPADFYVMMLNEVDRLLGDKGLDTRIVFLIYVDLLWPPERERIANPDRFILMFAPITRTFSRPFSATAALPALSPYARNRLTFPRSIEENVAFLRAWQAQFEEPLDSFDFDYHLMWSHLSDPGYMQISQVLHADLQRLHDLGLNGFNSCQTQRACFPTGLPMAVMGWTLWNRERDFDEMARDYFAAAFGPDGEACRAYLEQLGDLFDPAYLRGEKPDGDAEAAGRLKRVPALVDAFRPVIERNVESANPCRAASWAYLRHHADMAVALAGALEARAMGDTDEASKRWQAVQQMVWEREDALHAVLDVWLFTKVMNRLFENDSQ